MVTKTYFGSLSNYEKGSIEIINDDPKRYVFSNIFDVANKFEPYLRVAVAKNFKYVVECMKAEGNSSWFSASHDEFALAMDGEVIIDYTKPHQMIDYAHEGAVKLNDKPDGLEMGRIVIRRGHMALLPKGCAYKFSASAPSVLLIQTIVGPNTKQVWQKICQQ